MKPQTDSTPIIHTNVAAATGMYGILVCLPVNSTYQLPYTVIFVDKPHYYYANPSVIQCAKLESWGIKHT